MRSVLESIYRFWGAGPTKMRNKAEKRIKLLRNMRREAGR